MDLPTTPTSTASSSPDSSSVRLGENRLQKVITPTQTLQRSISAASDSRPHTTNGSYWKEKALGRLKRPSILSPKMKRFRRVRASSAPPSRESQQKSPPDTFPRKNSTPSSMAELSMRKPVSETSSMPFGGDASLAQEQDIIEQIKWRKNAAYQNKLKEIAANSPVHLLYQSWKETRGYSNSVSVFWNHMKFYFKTQFDKDDYVPFNPDTYTISEEYEDISKFECFGRAVSLDMKELTPDWRKFLPSPPTSSGSKETKPEGAAKVAFGPRQEFEVQEFDSEAPATSCSRGGVERPSTSMKGSLKPPSRHTLEDEKFCYRQTTEAVAYPNDCIRGLIYKLYNVVGYDTELADVNDLAFNLEVLVACIASNNKKVMRRLLDKNKETAFLRNSIRDLCYQINEMQITIEELDFKVSQLDEKLNSEREALKRKAKAQKEELAYYKNFSNKRFTALLNEQSSLINDMNKFFKESNYSTWNSDTQSVLRSFATTIDSRIGEFGIFHAMNKELISENERLRKELNIYKDSPYLEKECQRLVQTIEEKNETVAQLMKIKENYRDLLVKKAAMQKELGVLRDHAEELERQMSSMEDSHRKQVRELSKLPLKQRRKTLGFFNEKLYQEEIHSLELQLEEAHDKLLISAEEISELHEKIAHIESEKNAIIDEKKDIVESLMSAKAEFQQREQEHLTATEQLETESEIKNRVLTKCLHIINRYQFELQSSNCEKKRDKFRTAFHYITRRQKDLKEISDWIETEVMKQLTSRPASQKAEAETPNTLSTPGNSPYRTQSSSIYSTMQELNTPATPVPIQPFSPGPLLLTNFNTHMIKEKDPAIGPPASSHTDHDYSSDETVALEPDGPSPVDDAPGLESAENHESAPLDNERPESVSRLPMDFRYGLDGLGAQRMSQLMKGRPRTESTEELDSTNHASLKISENSGTMWSNIDKSHEYKDADKDKDKVAPTRFIELISSDDESF
ncbi:AaceriAGL058Cp [[Ashbya] aceris (nom. inval.)]|nr:AaceriAGL058Cp [[Ashbya] aceris (nom. inval.)]